MHVWTASTRLSNHFIINYLWLLLLYFSLFLFHICDTNSIRYLPRIISPKCPIIDCILMSSWVLMLWRKKSMFITQLITLDCFTRLRKCVCKLFDETFSRSFVCWEGVMLELITSANFIWSMPVKYHARNKLLNIFLVHPNSNWNQTDCDEM